MKNWVIQHVRALLFTLRRFRHAPFSSLLNILVIGIALSLPAGLQVLLQNLQSLDQLAGSTPQISLFLNTDATQDDITRIENQLHQHKGIKQAEFVPRDQALAQLTESSGISGILGELTHNPLPDAFIVTPAHSGVAELAALRSELQQWPGLAHVQLDSAWAQKLDALLKFGRQVVVLLAVLLSIALVAVTFNTIRLQILTQRDEIEISGLIGATPAFIRRPFLYFGLTQGLLGGLAAWIIVRLSLAALNTGLEDVTQLFARPFTLAAPPLRDGLSLLLFSGYLGWLGAWLSVSQHLNRLFHESGRTD